MENKENHEDDFVPNFPPNKSFEYTMIPKEKMEFVSTSKFTEDKIKIGPKYPNKQHFGREEMDFIKKCIKVYWEYHSNRAHPDNQKDWNISQNILNKQ